METRCHRQWTRAGTVATGAGSRAGKSQQMDLSSKDLIAFMGSISKVSGVLSRKRLLHVSIDDSARHRGMRITSDILIEYVETP